MKLHCPQCGLSQQVALSGMMLTIRKQTCRGCNSEIIVHKVSTARHNLNGQTVYCSNCSCEVPYSDSCSSCQSRFTGYLAVFPESLHDTAADAERVTLSAIKRASSQFMKAIAARIKNSPLHFRIIAGVVLLLLLLLSGGVIQHRHRNAERKYLTNYVMALYGIKSGFDRASAISSDLVADWHRNIHFGISSQVYNYTEEQSDLETVKREVDQLMRKLDDPPDSLHDAGIRLSRLNAVFERQHALASSAPQSSLPDYEQAVQSNHVDFQRSLNELKGALPPSLRQEVQNTSGKYNLNFMQ